MTENRELLACVARKDECAFRYALTLLHNCHLAEEVVQETMIAVWKSAGSFCGRSRVSTWIFGIARNQAHSIRLRERAVDRGYKLNEYGLFDKVDRPLAGAPKEEFLLSAQVG